MMPKYVVRAASSLFLMAAASGCHVTVTSTDSCGPDSTVLCGDGTQGYSCTGDVTPDTSTLLCGDAVCDGSDTCAYCCEAVSVTVTVPASCSSDPSVTGCEAGSYGYTCTGSASPDSGNPNLFCSSGTVSGANTAYCCLFTTSATVGCTADASVASGCNGEGADYGFSCTGGATPEETFTNLICGAPGTSGANTTYCCNAAGSTTVTASCTADTTLDCFGGSSGFTCTGNATPTASNCSQPSVGPTGDTYYCCGGSTGACAADSTVTGCQADRPGTRAPEAPRRGRPGSGAAKASRARTRPNYLLRDERVDDDDVHARLDGRVRHGRFVRLRLLGHRHAGPGEHQPHVQRRHRRKRRQHALLLRVSVRHSRRACMARRFRFPPLEIA